MRLLLIDAGRTGLVLAFWLNKLGVKLRIVDKTTEPGTTSRALAVQARTFELYRQLDLADTKLGHKAPAASMWVKGSWQRDDRLRRSANLTPFSFLEVFPQDQHERLLIDRGAQFGVTVERRCELKSFSDDRDRITARLRGPDGQQKDLCGRLYCRLRPRAFDLSRNPLAP